MKWGRAVPVSRAVIERKLNDIRGRIAAAAERAGRSAEAVTIVAVTKTVGIEEIRALMDLGVTHFGENRLPDCLDKVETIGPEVTWHFVGNLQRRKVRDAVGYFERIDAVDRRSLADELEKRAEQAERVVPVLLEVNASGEESKSGVTPADLPELLEHVNAQPHLEAMGLLTMAPFTDNWDIVRPVFARIRELADAHGLPVRSMGMSNDFEVAVEEGATEVRIGTSLFRD